MSSVMWDGRELAERYDRVSDLQFNSGRRLVEKMKITKNDAVLDIGCGTGRLALYLSKALGPTASIVGIDPSPHRIRVAEDRLKGSGAQNVRFMIGQAEDLMKFPGDSFDGAYYSSVIHWVNDKQAAFGEAYRVLKAGGRVGMTTVDKSHPFEMRHIMEKLFSREPYAGKVDLMAEMNLMLDKNELIRLLDGAGFVDIRIDMIPESHHFSSADELFDFIEASSFGNFLKDVPEGLRFRALQDMKKEVEKIKTASGIDLSSSTMFATAVKPD